VNSILNLFDEDLCKYFFDFHVFSFLLFSLAILSYTFILPVQQLQTQHAIDDVTKVGHT